MVDERADTSQGLGVDRYGNPVIDPTKNVERLVEEAVKRIDDLRTESQAHSREIRDSDKEFIRAMLTAEKEKNDLRAQFYDELRVAESDRINAIRAVDVEAVQRAAEAMQIQAATLATQVATSAETLRTAAAATTERQAEILEQALRPLRDAVAVLTQAQYETQGSKANVVESRAAAGETRLNLNALIGIAGFATAALVLILQLMNKG
jgi:hypothetical protein